MRSSSRSARMRSPKLQKKSKRLSRSRARTPPTVRPSVSPACRRQQARTVISRVEITVHIFLTVSVFLAAVSLGVSQALFIKPSDQTISSDKSDKSAAKCPRKRRTRLYLLVFKSPKKKNHVCAKMSKISK